MQIDWVHFTPWSALSGGLLIGLAASWLVLIDGRVLGASGILADLLAPRPGDWLGRLALLCGLIGSAPIARHWFAVGDTSLATGGPILIVGGLLVGFGTRLGNGCTSGHGVCGLARLSPRSAVATGVFMAAGLATVFVVRHLLA